MLNKWLTVLIFLIVLIPAALYAESTVKVFQTQQPGQALIPTITPLYADTAKITARNNTLIVKAPHHILLEIEQLLKEIDQPLRNLLIEVSSSLDGSGTYQQNSVQGRIKIGDDAVIKSRAPEHDDPNMSIRYGKNGSVIKTTHTRRSSSKNTPEHFKIRAVEGNWSYIQVGQKVPYYTANNYGYQNYGYQNNGYKNYGYNNRYRPLQNSVQLVDVTSGFDVYPTVNGELVTLKVRPHNSSMNRKHPDRINTRAIDTVVTGKIGQWIYLGGAGNQVNEQSSGYVYSTRRHSELDIHYKIKVNIID